MIEDVLHHATHLQHSSCAVSPEDRFVEHAIDRQLAQMRTALLRTELARIHDELTRTFARCPDWASALLPSLMVLALRLELGRSRACSPKCRADGRPAQHA